MNGNPTLSAMLYPNHAKSADTKAKIVERSKNARKLLVFLSGRIPPCVYSLNHWPLQSVNYRAKMTWIKLGANISNKKKMISVIIPAYNEEVCIGATIQWLWKNDDRNLIKEIIVVDGGSTDNTVSIAKTEGVKIVIAPRKGRASQMNFGASLATGKILYFLHADTTPPKHFTTEIAHAVELGYGAGCYRLTFDINHWFLKASGWLTRFDVDAIRFGDQSLFVTRDAFLKVGGFCEKHVVLEDQQLIKRLKRIIQFTLIKKSAITSARKYLENGIYKTQSIFFIIYVMYHLGFSQQKLVATYRKWIVHSKI